MAKTTTELGDDGRPVTYKTSRHQRRSEQQLIGWTPGPKNAWQRFVRKAVG